MEWQPIETAPLNGSPVLLRIKPVKSNDVSNYVVWDQLSIVVGWFVDGCWECGLYEERQMDSYSEAPFEVTVHPTHWMPLSDDPSEKE